MAGGDDFRARREERGQATAQEAARTRDEHPGAYHCRPPRATIRGPFTLSTPVRFPGSKLLHHWDLPSPNLSLDELFRSCQQAGLTGLVEVKGPQTAAMIFYYAGGEVNALFRDGALAYNGAEALEKLRASALGDSGDVSVFELPLDMAHLLRGIVKRQRLRETLKGKADLVDFLQRMERAEHTGTVEVQTARGSAMILVVRGRVSNMYWEATGGSTFEKGEARQRLEQALEREAGMIFLAEFSRDVWKSRHEVQSAVRSRLERRDLETAPAEVVVADEVQFRNELLDELVAQVPALIQASIFDLLTGSVYARRGRGSFALKTGLLAEKVPALMRYVRDIVTMEDDEIEVLHLSTARVAVVVAVVPSVQEALAVLAENSQPTALIDSTLRRLARSYASRLDPARA